ncbi:alpha/beta hydrolase [Carnobacterium alterfunditum]|nr:alpha/beta hydrolase family protein [Carnobacterium alterfunditum]
MMSVISGQINSSELGFTISYKAILPEEQIGPYPVLYLLHGSSDDDSSWLYNSSLVRYAAQYNIAIFMPQVHLSYYTDMYMGANYWSFLTKEFPQKMKNIFNISHKREETFVAGLSMGGYGALKWGLSYPEQVAGVAALSAAVDPYRIWQEDPDRDKLFTAIFESKESLKGSENDLYALLEQLKGKTVQPSFLQICGMEDFLYADNLNFKKHLQAIANDYTYLENPGDHDWAFWDQEIQVVLKWIQKNIHQKRS